MKRSGTEDEGQRRKWVALLVAGIAFILIVLDLSGAARTASKPPQGTERSTATSTVYVTQTVTNRAAQGGSAPETQATTPTTSHTSSNTIISYTYAQTQLTSIVTPTANRLEDWMLFVSLDPQPSFTASGIWRINQTTVRALIILVGNFSTHLVPYRAVLNLTIKGPGIDATFHQEDLPPNGRIETRTTAYELILNHVHPLKTPTTSSRSSSRGRTEPHSKPKAGTECQTRSTERSSLPSETNRRGRDE